MSRIQVDEYLTERGSESEQEAGADYTLQILDVVLKSEHSLNNQQVIANKKKLKFMTEFVNYHFRFRIIYARIRSLYLKKMLPGWHNACKY